MLQRHIYAVGPRRQPKDALGAKCTSILKNSFGDVGYGGPQPPKGTGDPPYVFTLYALSVEKLDLGANTSLSTFKKALEGKTLGSAKITGNYGR